VATPILPLFGESIGANCADIGLTLSAFAAARLVLNIPIGILADRYGRKPLLVAGPLISAVGMVGSGLSSSIPELLFWRIIAGAGNAAYLGGAQLYLLDNSTEENRGRVISANHAALLCGVGAGPAIGGLAGSLYGLQAPFFLVGAMGVLTSIYGARRLEESLVVNSCLDKGDEGREKREEVRSKSGFDVTRDLLSDPRFASAGLANAVSFAVRAGGRNTLYTLFAIQAYGYNASDLGWVFTSIAAVDLLLVGPSAWLSDRYRHNRSIVIVPGMIVSSVAYVGLSMMDGDHHGSFLLLTSIWALSLASQGAPVPPYHSTIPII